MKRIATVRRIYNLQKHTGEAYNSYEITESREYDSSFGMDHTTLVYKYLNLLIQEEFYFYLYTCIYNEDQESYYEIRQLRNIFKLEREKIENQLIRGESNE